MERWHADRQCCRDIRPLARRERFPVAGPGKVHGRPRTVFFVLACTNWTLVGTEAAFERRERVVSVAPHMLEMEAEVAAVTRHRSVTRLEAAEPRSAPSRRAPSVSLSRERAEQKVPSRIFNFCRPKLEDIIYLEIEE